MASGRTPILLLKTKSSPKDAYEEYFNDPANGSYDPRFAPVLDHQFKQDGVRSLQSHIENGAFVNSAPGGESTTPRYGGLIFTSQRAVDAFSAVINDLRAAGVPLQQRLPAETPVYVVGPATARGVRALDLACPVVGEHTGNGDALAAFILDDYNARRVASGKPDADSPGGGAAAARPGLLFVVGEQHRDAISKTLPSDAVPLDRRIAVTELTVYGTVVMESFASDFAAQIQPALREGLSQWIVVFSPTGCRVMLEGLNLLDSETGKVKAEAARESRKTRIATIGPTTRDFLVREFGFQPDACATKPSPEGLVASIDEFNASYSKVNA